MCNYLLFLKWLPIWISNKKAVFLILYLFMYSAFSKMMISKGQAIFPGCLARFTYDFVHSRSLTLSLVIAVNVAPQCVYSLGCFTVNKCCNSSGPKPSLPNLFATCWFQVKGVSPDICDNFSPCSLKVDQQFSFRKFTFYYCFILRMFTPIKWSEHCTFSALKATHTRLF